MLGCADKRVSEIKFFILIRIILIMGEFLRDFGGPANERRPAGYEIVSNYSFRANRPDIVESQDIKLFIVLQFPRRGKSG